MPEIKITKTYPYNPDYFYETKLERVNMDEEREKSINSGHGFVISELQSTLKKELKNNNGIFSPRFGQTLDDITPFKDRYKCECGTISGRMYIGITCPKCKKKVKYVDDDLNYFGWICLKDPYYIMHPNLYKEIGEFFGMNKAKESILDRILMPVIHIDKDGKIVEEEPPKDEPFFGIGILEFRERFGEILKYYYTKSKKKDKDDYYYDICLNKDKVFIQSIPVYSLLLRPYKIDGPKFSFVDNNAIYHLMTKIAFMVNNDELKILRKLKPKLQYLYDLNCKYIELYNQIDSQLQQKKGVIRSLFGGRLIYSLLK